MLQPAVVNAAPPNANAVVKRNAVLRGQLHFEEACAYCHSTCKGVIDVGPSLFGLGGRMKRNEILEAIEKPNAKIAKGFENATLLLVSGRVLNGKVTVADGVYRVEVEPGVSKTFLAKDVEDFQPSRSAMPEGTLDDLDDRQKSDLINFLGSLKPVIEVAEK
ncbi:hypothetical protein [Stratiformator vulcanicus]|nr:hypothetical protein [Stratiformator vulcanicus]